MYITKSDYTNFIQCPRLFYNRRFNKEKAAPLDDMAKSLIEIGNQVGKYATTYFDDGYFVNRLKISNEDAVKETANVIKRGYKHIYEASFIYKDLFCAVDILQVNDDGTFDIIEVKSGKSLKEHKAMYFQDASFQYYVLTKLGYKIKNVLIMHPNPLYIFKDKPDIKTYFEMADVELVNNVEDNINEMRKIINMPPLIARTDCRKCPFFNLCYKHLGKNNIFDITGNVSQADKYNAGIQTFKDLIDHKNEFKQTDTFLNAIEQAEFEVFNKPTKVDKAKVKEFLNGLELPYYFLDFETVKDVFPFINGTDIEFQRIMQYSLHVQYKQGDAPVQLKPYLQDRKYDNIEEVADLLISQLGDKGSIIVYNHYENDCFNRLIKLLPHKADKLEAIRKRLKDMMKPFQYRAIYDKDMEGSYSIKKVLPALCKNYKDAYKDLPIVHNGGQIDYAYDILIHSHGKEHDELYDAMLKYCEQDTLSEVYVLDKMFELIK